MNADRLSGAVAGGLLAGLGITALLMAGERRSGQPYELAQLERAAAGRLGLRRRRWRGHARPGPGEQSFVQGGHLLLSGLAGAAYAATVDDDTGVLPGGIGFGLAFYAAMHWFTGPLLGVKRPEWQSDGRTIGLHAANHVLVGLMAAAGARLATRSGT